MHKTRKRGTSEDEGVERWLRNLRRGSPITAEVAMRRLRRACELLDTDPKSMLANARRNVMKFQDELEDLVSKLEAEKKAPGYITGILKAVRSWLKYNDITLTRPIKVTDAGATPTIEDEQVPTQEELSRIFRASPPRVRVAEALVALADLRLQTIGNHDGSDGLMLKDLPELRIKGKEVAFEKIPTMVVVRAALSKARHKYFTFLPSEGCTFVKEYLEERLRNHEELSDKSPLIGHERPGEKPFMITVKIADLIRDCMRRAGVSKRPYVLRAYAETQLIIAESKGKISHPYIQFIAGHKGDIEARYSTNKGRLPPNMIEDIREAYKRCEPFLSTIAQPIEQSSMVKEAKVEALKSIAKNLLSIDLIEVKVEKEKEFGRELSREEEIELFEGEIRKLRIEPQKFRDEKDCGANCSHENRLIAEGELVDYLNGGWTIVRELRDGRIAVRKEI